jgi:hypothetical protein
MVIKNPDNKGEARISPATFMWECVTLSKERKGTRMAAGEEIRSDQIKKVRESAGLIPTKQRKGDIRVDSEQTKKSKREREAASRVGSDQTKKGRLNRVGSDKVFQ